MAKRKRSPPRLSNAAIRARQTRIDRIAEQMGFVGHLEYRNAYSSSGGAQYGQAPLPEDDFLIVYAEAFDRDADPGDFSLEAMLAYERGHQVLVRHPRIARLVADRMTPVIEEVMASVVGALLCGNDADRDNLIAKAAFELILRGAERETAARQIDELRLVLEQLL